MGLMNELPKVLDKIPGGNTLTNAVDFVVNWARANSLWPLTFGTSCCAIEMMATAMPRYDIARFGSEAYRATPRQADLIIIAGTIVEKMAGPLEVLYKQMPGPKYVIAMGACAISGGPFYYDSYSTIKGADRVIPVDVYVPGCPPRPEALLYGLMELQKKIKSETIRDEWKAPETLKAPPVNHHAQAAAQWKEQEKIKDAEMKEARKKFKEENPDYKAYKHVKIPKDKFDAVDYVEKPRQGLEPTVVFNHIKDKFPSVTLTNLENSEELGEQRNVYVLDVTVSNEEYYRLVEYVKSEPAIKMEYLIQLTAIDWKKHFEVLVHLTSLDKGHSIYIRTQVDRPKDFREATEEQIPSLAPLFPGAVWHERETYDFFGIRFKDNPDMRRILLDDSFNAFPLRKDFDDPIRVVKRPY